MSESKNHKLRAYLLIVTFAAITTILVSLMTIETDKGLLIHSIADFTGVPAAFFLLAMPTALLLFIPAKNFRTKFLMLGTFFIASLGLLILFLVPSAIVLMHFYN